jgi:imidazolonepropionase-like amidohydrolase
MFKNMKTTVILALGLLLALQGSAADSKIVAVRFAKLWDGSKVIDKPLVIIENDRIRSVQGGDPPAPAGAVVVDWSKYYGVPGLLDMHTHMTYYWDGAPGTRPLGERRLPAETVYLARENARKTLEAGVTTVRDLGSQDFTDIAMRNLINRGAMLGPRMFVCGYGLSLPWPESDPNSPPVISPGSAENPDQVMIAVRRQIAAGADVIKMYGSVGGFDDVDTQQTFTFEEMKAAVEVSHTMGKKIAIHSYGPEGARDAVRAGADSLEHAVDIDDATLAEMVKRGTYYVPTIDHNRYYLDAAKEYQFKPGYEEHLRAYIDRNVETARRAHKAGVKFAMGSDAVFTMFGQNSRELAWFVKVGMTPEEALKTATVNAADLLGQSVNVGSIRPGRYADLVAVEGDPLSDIHVVIDKVRGVMKGGAIVVGANQSDPVPTN